MQHLVSAIFPDAPSAHRAADELVASGVPQDHISVLAQDTHHDALRKSASHTNVVDHNAGRGAVAGSALGAIAGGIVALASLGIPGGLIVAGPLVAALGGLALGAGGGGVVGALIGTGIPEADAKDYERHVDEGRILVSVHATNDAGAYLARHVLERMNPTTPPRVHDTGGALTP